MNFVTRSLCLRSNSNKLLYPLHSALLLCLRSLMSFPSLSPFIFVHFFLFLFKSPIVSCTEHNGHYLCFNDLNCEEQRHEKKKNLQPTIITTSCGYSVVVYYCVCCTFMLLCIAYPFCPQIIDIPLKGTGVLVPIYWPRFSSPAATIAPTERYTSRSARPRKRKRGKKVFRLCVSKKYFLFRLCKIISAVLNWTATDCFAVWCVMTLMDSDTYMCTLYTHFILLLFLLFFFRAIVLFHGHTTYIPTRYILQFYYYCFVIIIESLALTT